MSMDSQKIADTESYMNANKVIFKGPQAHFVPNVSFKIDHKILVQSIARKQKAEQSRKSKKKQ